MSWKNSFLSFYFPKVKTVTNQFFQDCHTVDITGQVLVEYGWVCTDWNGQILVEMIEFTL